MDGVNGTGVWTVGSLVQAIRRMIEGVPEWKSLWVEGELSGVKAHSSGHWYFTLKDREAQIRCVLFRRDAAQLTFAPQDGMAVRVLGRLGVFERDGQTQLYATRLQQIGAGEAFQALEELKRKLYAEGLFSRPKRKLPLLPRALGVVTSASGAARYDIETVVARRFPTMPIRFIPVQVQGKTAPEAIVAALAQITRDMVDVVILGRGGGSREDLAVFNDERVVRAAFACPVPLISAVGHEIDTTLTDLVADMRAPTPSAAAEMAVPEWERLVQWVADLDARAERALAHRLNHQRERWRRYVDHGVLAHPDALVREVKVRLDRIDERAERALERLVGDRRRVYERVAGLIGGLDPERILHRGYTYVTDRKGRPVNWSDVRAHERYAVHWYNGNRWMQALEDGETHGRSTESE